MHVPHHMPASDPNARLQPRKPAVQKDTDVYARIVGSAGDKRQRGSEPPPQRRTAPDDPSKGAMIDPRALGEDAPPKTAAAPFMAVTDVTTFWMKLARDTGTDRVDGSGPGPMKAPARTNAPSLLDLFSDAIKQN